MMYGRNKLIKPNTKSYLKTPLKHVESINVQKIKAEILNASNISNDDIDNIVIYGELMCNKDLFKYDEEKLYGKCPIFGAMIKVS